MSDKVYVSVLPKCDFCSDSAKYDARTLAGPWANMCANDFYLYGNGKLGTGYGQEFVIGEAPEASPMIKELAAELGMDENEVSSLYEDFNF